MPWTCWRGVILRLNKLNRVGEKLFLRPQFQFDTTIRRKKSRAGREIWLWLSSQSVLFFFFFSKLSYVSSWWWQAAAKTEKTGSKSHDASRIKIITMVILLIRHWFRHRQWWESHCYACCYSWNLKKKLIKNKTHRLLDWLPSQRLLSTVARPCGRFSIVPSTRNWCFYFRSVTPKQMPPYPIWNAKPSMTSWSSLIKTRQQIAPSAKQSQTVLDSNNKNKWQLSSFPPYFFFIVITTIWNISLVLTSG